MCNFYTMPFVHSMYPIEDTMDWASSQKEYNQSHFCIDHLVMSMYRVVSCVVGKGFLL